MKDLLHYIVKNLVDHPDDIAIKETERDGEIVLELTVNPEDMGKVIGRQGRIAKSIRTIVRSIGNRENKKVTIDILG